MRPAPQFAPPSGVRMASSASGQPAWPNVRLESDRLAELARPPGFGLALHGYSARNELARSIEAMSETTKALKAENAQLRDELEAMQRRFYTQRVYVDEARLWSFRTQKMLAA